MSLDKLKKSLNTKHGKDTAKMGTAIPEKTPIISSTGSYRLDTALGCMGIPRGRVLEYYGPPSGGKTTLSLLTAIEVQQTFFEYKEFGFTPEQLVELKLKKIKGTSDIEDADGKKGRSGVVAFIDLEGTFTKDWFRNLGGDPDNLLYIKPDKADEVFEIMDEIVRSNEVDLIITDSVSAMATEAELEGEYGSAHMAVLARLMSQGLKIFNNTMSKNPWCSSIFINQIRSGMDKYHPEETSGGNALKFYSSIRLAVRRGEIIGEKDNPAGFVTKIKTVKNKCGPPLRVTEVRLYIGTTGKFGIDKDEEVVGLGMDIGLVKRMKNSDAEDETGKKIKVLIEDEKGQMYKFSTYDAVRGKDAFIEMAKANKELFDEMKSAVTTFVLNKQKPTEDSFAATVQKTQ